MPGAGRAHGCRACNPVPWSPTPRCMSRAATPQAPLPAPEPAPPEPEPASQEVAVGPPEPGPGRAQPLRRDLGKVPKWLKLPGTVGAARPGGAAGLEPGAPGHPGLSPRSQQEVSAASQRFPPCRQQDPSHPNSNKGWSPPSPSGPASPEKSLPASPLPRPELPSEAPLGAARPAPWQALARINQGHRCSPFATFPWLSPD